MKSTWHPFTKLSFKNTYWCIIICVSLSLEWNHLICAVCKVWVKICLIGRHIFRFLFYTSDFAIIIVNTELLVVERDVDLRYCSIDFCVLLLLLKRRLTVRVPVASHWKDLSFCLPFQLLQQTKKEKGDKRCSRSITPQSLGCYL